MLQPWFETSFFTASNYLDFLCRILIAALCGGLIGLERERRFKNAGLRTHIIVALASAVLMIISKYAFFDIVVLTDLKIQVDAARVAAGVIQAIGFLGAGIIFVKRENVVGLTTAAGLWATVGIGLAMGAGLYSIGIAATFLILGMQAILHFKHSKSHSQFSGNITCRVGNNQMTPKTVAEKFRSMGILVRSMSIKKIEGHDSCVIVNVVFNEKKTIDEISEELGALEFIDSMDIFPVF